MILALAATEIEMQPFLLQWSGTGPSCLTLVTGVGPMETAFRLTRFLCEANERVHAVINFGIGGAYLQPVGHPQPELLELCLAEQEVVGDLGICLQNGVEYLDRSLTGELTFPLDSGLLGIGRKILVEAGEQCFCGVFVTVNAASATRERGDMLQGRWQGLCENMEGAAVARVCREFAIPCMELRAISNYVEDRKPQNWRLYEACLKAAQLAALIIKGMSV
ncbi:MAG: futalosine hydrolase [Proteobacteria bacterium]|nr:futalosine hydrolase [Pseudomonadota bacterium]